MQRERRRKQYWRLADFQEAAPAAAGFEDIRTGAQFAAQSVQEKVYFFDSDFGRPAGGGDAFGPNRHADGVVR